MTSLDDKLQASKKSFRAKFILGALGVGVLLAAVLPAVYFTYAVTFRIEPPAARANASVTITEGTGLVLGNTIYLLGARATVRFRAPRYRDHEERGSFKNRRHLAVTLREAPAQVVISTRPALPETEWSVAGVYVATAAEFTQELARGTYEIRANHPFYVPQTLSVAARAGERFTRSLTLTPVAGSLRIQSEPSGARVFIDGLPSGLTPLPTIPLAGGAYDVRVVLDDFQPSAEKITITNRAQKVARTYRLRINHLAIAIQTAPKGGILSVDGVDVPATNTVSLSVGRHVIRYAKPGYTTQTEEVTLQSGAPSPTLIFQLKKEIGEVIVRSTPSAAVRVNGKSVGDTPLTLRLQTLPQRVTLVSPGYAVLEVRITPSAGAPVLIDKVLQTELEVRLAKATPILTAAAGIKMKLFIPDESKNWFTMGAPVGEKGRRANEFERAVTLTKPFYVGVTEITEAQFSEYQPRSGAGKKLPVRNVSWVQAAGFCNWLSARDGLQPVYTLVGQTLQDFSATADGYRLLSEAEWEWLARVVNRLQRGTFVWGERATIPKKSGNFADESAKGALKKYIPRYNDGFSGVAPVASFAADVAGLYDMAGNVSEWVHDVYDLRPPSSDAVFIDPFGARPGEDTGAIVGAGHVFKGASFRSASLTSLRSSFRDGALDPRDDVGFRIARYLYGPE